MSLDLFTFSQKDKGGNPLRAEAFRYNSTRLALRNQLNEEESVRLEVNFAVIDNSRPQTMPASVFNASTTSASVDLTTLDFLGTLDLDYKDSR